MNNTASAYKIGQSVVDIESGIVGEVVEVTTEGVKIVTGNNRRPSWMREDEIRPAALPRNGFATFATQEQAEFFLIHLDGYAGRTMKIDNCRWGVSFRRAQ